MAKYIIFTADVQIAQIARLRTALTEAINAGEQEIYLAISSGGGLVAEGIAIAALIKSLPAKVTTHNIGQTDSVANVIFAAGTKRLANPNANFLFHGVTQTLNNAVLSEAQVKELYSTTVRLREMIASNFSTYSGMSLADVTSLMTNGASILSAQESLTKGITHEVRDFMIPPASQIVAIGNM